MTYCQIVVSPPSPATGLLGGSATFTCEVNFTVGSVYMEWFFGSGIIYYYSNGFEDYPNGQGNYEAQRQGNIFNLTITNLELSHAGIYECNLLTIPDSLNATLIVLGE